MEDLSFKINVVLNECSRSLYNIEKEEPNTSCETVFKAFISGPLLQFVKAIQVFLKSLKYKNIYMICVCLSQIRKCILMHETAMSEQKTVLDFKKILNTYLLQRIQKCFYKLEDCLEMLDLMDLDEHPGIFIDRMNIVLNGLNNRDNFELIKPNVDKILFQAITIAKVSDEIDNLEITSSSKQVLKAVQNINKMDINEVDNVFQFDSLSSSLSILERRINTAILHLIVKIFNDPFDQIKQLLKKCGDSNDTQIRSASDVSSLISDLDKSTDILIQIGLFSIACCKNNEYVIPLKCCISSLELLENDLVPSIIKFYLDRTSIVKKTFLKLLINHWVHEICEMQNCLDKIIDPFAYAQTTLEMSLDIIDTICKSNPNTKIDLHGRLLTGFINFKKYIGKIFSTEISKQNMFSTDYEQFKSALKEYKACLIFNKKTNNNCDDESTQKKLFKRCEIVIKYLKKIQTSICITLENESSFELNNSSYILSKTKQCFEYLSSNDKSDDPSLILPSFQIGRSFYNKSERKTTKSFYQQDFCLNNFNETVYENTVTMDLTNILDNFIATSNINNDDKTAVNIWEEVDIDTSVRFLDPEI